MQKVVRKLKRNSHTFSSIRIRLNFNKISEKKVSRETLQYSFEQFCRILLSSSAEFLSESQQKRERNTPWLSSETKKTTYNLCTFMQNQTDQKAVHNSLQTLKLFWILIRTSPENCAGISMVSEKLYRTKPRKKFELFLETHQNTLRNSENLDRNIPF